MPNTSKYYLSGGVNCKNALNVEGLLCEFPDVYGKTRPNHKIPRRVIKLIIMKDAFAAANQAQRNPNSQNTFVNAVLIIQEIFTFALMKSSPPNI